MTIKEVAEKTGLSHQAIYKRLKNHGVKLDSIRDKATGQITLDGEAIISELFPACAGPSDTLEKEKPAEKPVETQVENEVEKLRNQVAELTTEVEKLRNQVATLENERDFLRTTLEREQQLQGIALSKLPPALPPAEAERGKLRSWWDRVRGRA